MQFYKLVLFLGLHTVEMKSLFLLYNVIVRAALTSEFTKLEKTTLGNFFNDSKLPQLAFSSSVNLKL